MYFFIREATIHVKPRGLIAWMWVPKIDKA